MLRWDLGFQSACMRRHYSLNFLSRGTKPTGSARSGWDIAAESYHP
ncbi:hypothetical protein BH11PLA1_BH11PLA1_23700 [soil metagenome]